MTIKIKDKKLLGLKCILDNCIQREYLNYRGLFVDKGSRFGIFPDPDPGDPKRPDSDPDPQHWIISTYPRGVISFGLEDF